MYKHQDGTTNYAAFATTLRNVDGNPRHRAAPGQCAYCDRERAAGTEFHPHHDASKNCAMIPSEQVGENWRGGPRHD